MSTVSYALTTKEKVKTYIGIATGDTSKDALIDMLIAQVTDFIENFCGGRRFKSTSYVEIYDSNKQDGTIKGSKLFLNQFPVTTTQTTTVVEYRSGTPSSPQWVTYNNNAYLLYDKSGYIHFYSILPVIAQGLRVTYTAGYLIDFANEFSATHTLPFDLTMVATELVAQQLNIRQSQGIASQSTEGQSITFKSDGAMTANQKAILRKYAVPRMAI